MTTTTEYQRATNPRRIGSLPSCIALGGSDVGEATVDGRRVTITWGRNLPREKADWFAANTGYVPVRTGGKSASEEYYELVIPDPDAAILREIVRW